MHHVAMRPGTPICGAIIVSRCWCSTSNALLLAPAAIAVELLPHDKSGSSTYTDKLTVKRELCCIGEQMTVVCAATPGDTCRCQSVYETLMIDECATDAKPLPIAGPYTTAGCSEELYMHRCLQKCMHSILTCYSAFL
eukprot:1588-Heterococcus_DN1.PRE.9